MDVMRALLAGGIAAFSSLLAANAWAAIDPADLSRTAVLTFADDFIVFRPWNGTAGWDTRWSYAPSEGSRGYNDELQWYVAAGYRPTASVTPWIAVDGVLEITAARAARHVRPFIGDAEYTSGKISTFHAFSQVYGYFEMRATVPAGQGLWTAFWMLPVANKSQEIDIMEVLGHKTDVLHNAAHSYMTGAIESVGQTTRVDDMSVGFHTYGLHWTPETLTYYFDRKPMFSTPTPPDMHEPMYLIVNLAVGGRWPGNPAPQTAFPATLRVDYIRAYRAKPANLGTTVPPVRTGGHGAR